MSTSVRQIQRKLLSANKFKGFTLIELLIAVSIIAVLAVIGIVVFAGAQRNSRDARRKADINAIAKAMEVKLVNDNSGLYSLPAGSDFAGGVIPTPPEGGNYSVQIGDGSSFTACATLENRRFFCMNSIQGIPSVTLAAWCTVCAADINGDGVADLLDFSIIDFCLDKSVSLCIKNGVSYPKADINGDGMVNQPDFDCLHDPSLFGETC